MPMEAVVERFAKSATPVRLQPNIRRKPTAVCCRSERECPRAI